MFSETIESVSLEGSAPARSRLKSIKGTKSLAHSLSRSTTGLTHYIMKANSYFEVLGEKAPHIKLTEVNGDAVEEEVTISGSIVDGDKALEVLVECFC